MSNSKFRIGQGYDVHQLASNRPLVLGGVTIKHETGLAGNSDADVLIHSLCDACLGAIAAGDIGTNFPDSDPTYKDIDSRELLRQVSQLINQEGYFIVNVDVTVMAERPRLAPYINRMRQNIANDFGCSVDQISIKATTTEGLGFIGKQQGIATTAVVLLESQND